MKTAFLITIGILLIVVPFIVTVFKALGAITWSWWIIVFFWGPILIIGLLVIFVYLVMVILDINVQ